MREQLKQVVSQLWDDHRTYMGDRKKERQVIWQVLSNGLAALHHA